MLFLEPTRTPYDLNLSVGDIPVRVHPSFWIFSAILGWPYVELGFGYLLLWVGCMFVSILVHELGHVMMGRVFGRPAHIVLYAIGGLAIGNFQVPSRWQRILISAAGPAAGLLLYAAVWMIRRSLDPEVFIGRPYLVLLLFMLLWQNLIWNVLNLIPVWPLDGGHISREICTGFFRRNGLWLSLGLSFVLAGLGAVYSLLCAARRDLPYPSVDPVFSGIFLGLLAIQSFQLLQQAEYQRRYRNDDWERDPDVWGGR